MAGQRNSFYLTIRNYSNDLEISIKNIIKIAKENGDVRGIEAMRPFLNPNSLEIKKAYVEKWLATRKPMEYLQFQRIGYYNVDPESTPDRLVFNRTVGLTDAWKKMNK